MIQFENAFREKIVQIASSLDPAHDFLHFQRVVILAKKLCHLEKGNPQIVIPAAWLHDMVIVPKDSPSRLKASQMSAEQAIQFLQSIQYPSTFYEEIYHAIEAHSFSAGITPRTLAAQIVQDADRLDGLGAIGLARCFVTAGLLRRPIYCEADPFCENRIADDQKGTIDHFYTKLFKVAESLRTPSGRHEGQRRLQIMRRFFEDLKPEICLEEDFD